MNTSLFTQETKALFTLDICICVCFNAKYNTVSMENANANVKCEHSLTYLIISELSWIFFLL